MLASPFPSIKSIYLFQVTITKESFFFLSTELSSLDPCLILGLGQQYIKKETCRLGFNWRAITHEMRHFSKTQTHYKPHFSHLYNGKLFLTLSWGKMCHLHSSHSTLWILMCFGKLLSVIFSWRVQSKAERDWNQIYSPDLFSEPGVCCSPGGRRIRHDWATGQQQ